jgi:hypothetical protein
MSLTRPPEYNSVTDQPRDIRILRGLGANYGVGMEPQRLQYRDGVFEIVEDEEKPGRRQRTLTHQDRLDLRYRLLAGIKRTILNGGRVPADEMHRESMPNRARRSPETMLNTVAFNDLYTEQQALIDAGQLVRVEVQRACCLRPLDGPYYRDEAIWMAAAQ